MEMNLTCKCPSRAQFERRTVSPSVGKNCRCCTMPHSSCPSSSYWRYHCRWASKAVSAALGEYAALQNKFRGKQVVITEVGWPSRSGEMDTNRASTDDAVAFARAWVQVCLLAVDTDISCGIKHSRDAALWAQWACRMMIFVVFRSMVSCNSS